MPQKTFHILREVAKTKNSFININFLSLQFYQTINLFAITAKHFSAKFIIPAYTLLFTNVV